MCRLATLRITCAFPLILAMAMGGLYATSRETPVRQADPPTDRLDEIVNIDMRTDVRVFTVLAAAAVAGHGPIAEDRSPLLERLLSDIINLDQGVVDRLRIAIANHRLRGDVARQTAYISLALLLTGPPDFELRSDVPEMPADVQRILGFERLLPDFYVQAGIEQLWNRYHPAYLAELEAYRPVMKSVVRETLEYFHIPARIVLDRQIILIPNLLGRPDVVHARNLERTYYIVVGPTTDAASNFVLLQHEYLHFLVDPLIEKYGGRILRARNLLELAHRQPHLARDFHDRFLLIVGESLIEAVLHRLHPVEDWDSRLVELFRRGLIFVPHFMRVLDDFERIPDVSFPLFLEDAVGSIEEDLIREDARQVAELERELTERRKSERDELERQWEDRRRAERIAGLLNESGQALSRKDWAAAESLLAELLEFDPENGQALFYLGQIAAQRERFDEALDYYLRAERSEEAEPWVRAWSAVRIGRQMAFRGDFEGARERFEEVVAVGDDLRGARQAALDSLAQLPGNGSP